MSRPPRTRGAAPGQAHGEPGRPGTGAAPTTVGPPAPFSWSAPEDAPPLGLESILEEASEVLLEQFVRRLLTWNFGSRLKSWGSFVMQPLQPDDLKLFADIFATLTNAGYMTPELRADLNAVRKRFRLDPVESLPALPLPAPVEPQSGKDLLDQGCLGSAVTEVLPPNLN